MAITFNNATYGPGFFARIVSNSGNSFTYNGSAIVTATLNGTVNAPGDTITFVNSNNVMDTLTATQFDNAGTIIFLGTNAAPAGSTQYLVFSNTQLPANQTITYTETNLGDYTPVCFASGTLIRTDRGEVAVERLCVGDTVVTVSGAHRPIKWIGSRTLDLARHPRPETVWPVRVQREAFGPGKPARDLWLSPAHAVFVDGGLIEIGQLVNGATVAQVPRETITYWHVELDTHDVILAEGLESETFLDTGNRRFFAGDVLDLHPGDVSSAGGTPCVPFIAAGPRLVAIKQALLDRARILGHSWTVDPDLHVVADGRRVDPVDVSDTHAVFDLPFAKSLRLVSRTWKPVEATAAQEDYRTLGVEVWRLTVDGAALPLGLVNDGWHALETDSIHTHRWTTGSTPLPRGCRRVVVEFNSKGRYLAVGPRSPANVRRRAAAV